VVVVGGEDGAGTVSREVLAFDVETRTWRQLMALPEPRSGLAGATTIHDKLYVAGGYTLNYADSLKNSLFVYDPATDTWTRKADVPTAQVCGGVQASIGGKLYLYSACNYGDFFVYTPATDKWRVLPKMAWDEAPFASPIGGSIGGKFYITGGLDAHGQSNLLHAYDPATNTWIRKRSMPTGREAAFAAVFHGKLFVAGGLVRSSDAWVETDKLEAYDPTTDTWAKGPAMRSPRALGASAWAGGKFYVLGGKWDWHSSLDKVETLSTPH
jgi:N-acetylneuraminic acid mutarotase